MDLNEIIYFKFEALKINSIEIEHDISGRETFLGINVNLRRKDIQSLVLNIYDLIGEDVILDWIQKNSELLSKNAEIIQKQRNLSKSNKALETDSRS